MAGRVVGASMDLQVELDTADERIDLLLQRGARSELHLTGLRLEKKSWPKAITKLTGLKELYLGHNRLHRIPEDVFTLASLEKLDLTDNGIVALPPSIGELQKLRSLHLSRNSLEMLPATLVKLKELHWIDLRANSIRDLQQEIIKDMPQLTLLWLDGNPCCEANRGLECTPGFEAWARGGVLGAGCQKLGLVARKPGLLEESLAEGQPHQGRTLNGWQLGRLPSPARRGPRPLPSPAHRADERSSRLAGSNNARLVLCTAYSVILFYPRRPRQRCTTLPRVSR